jgi:hypothetical protein
LKKTKKSNNLDFTNYSYYYNIDYSNLSLLDLKSILSFNLDVPLYTYQSIQNFENLPTSTLKIILNRPFTQEQFEKIYYKYNYRLNAIEHHLGLTEFGLKKIPEEGFTLSYMINLISK